MEAAVTKGRIDIQILPDLESLSHKAVEIFVDTSRRSIYERKSFSVAISGGSTPGVLYMLLGSDQYKDKIDWKHTHIFWSDERCVPPEHRDSNFRLAFEEFLSKVPVPDKNVHRIRGEKGPEQGAQEYEDELRKHFGTEGLPVFDLVLLGLGEEGHTASLFPGSMAIYETKQLVVPVYRDKPDHNRVSLSLPVLNHALHVVFLVAGILKSRAIANILMKEQNRDRYPVEPIQSVGRNVTWLLDKEAAALLRTGRVCCSA